MIESGNRDAPDALTGNAPFRSGVDEGFQPIACYNLLAGAMRVEIQNAYRFLERIRYPEEHSARHS